MAEGDKFIKPTNMHLDSEQLMSKLILQDVNGSPYFKRGSVGGYNAVTTAWIARVISEGGSVTTPEAIAVNTLTDSIPIGEFDRLWVHGLQNQVAARTSIANAATADLITNVNGTTFTAGQGFTGNGSTMYLDTKYNPTVDGVKYLQNDSSFGLYVRTNTDGTYVDIGSLGGGVLASMFTKLTGINFSYMNDDGTGSLGKINTDSRGFYTVRRSASGSFVIYRNGSSIGTETTTSTGLPNNDFYLLARNSNGSATLFSDRQIAVSYMASANYTPSDLNTAIQALATTLGFNV